MTLCSTILLGALLLGSPCGQADPDASNTPDRQTDNDRGQDGRRGPRERRGRDGDRRGRRPPPPRDGEGGTPDEQREQFRRQRQAYREATPEQRREMRIDHWLNMTSMTYDLTDEQRETVRQEMKTMADERRKEMGPIADEYEQLHDKMMERFDSLTENGEPGPDNWRRMRDDPELQRLRERMNEIETAYPFDFEAAGKRIEKLLPEEQVKKGQERIAEWQKRQQEWQQRREERRRERERDGDGSNRRRRGRPGADGGSSRASAELDKAKADAAAERDRLAAEQAAAADAAVAARTSGPIHPWEQYVRDFIAKHDLTESQKTAAMAILKDSRSRATQYEQSVEKRKADAEKLADKVAREETLKKLSQPVNDLFEELKLRLDGLLTATQRGDHVA